MTDIVDQSTRSRMMAAIGGRNTKPEIVLRRALHSLGFRFRLHSKQVFGRPDIVLAKHNAAIFVHGCFWHRHEGCRYKTTPASRREFWVSKFEANVARDAVVRATLLERGWRVAVVWECALRKPDQILVESQRLSSWLLSRENEIEIG
ncbi:MAG: very short patch repair endonuclease [Rhizobium sp.]|nr:very short patch repair endonuclease [Rhizobium sp.]MDM8015595.1 very short patch repair endonuclease [Rhizobium sp.]